MKNGGDMVKIKRAISTLREPKMKKMLIAMVLVLCIIVGLISNMNFSKRYAGGMTASAAASSVKTIYFDTNGVASWITADGWSRSGDIYVYLWSSSDSSVTAVTKLMDVSINKNTLIESDGMLYEIEVDTSKYDRIIFKNLEGWGTSNATQTVDVSLSTYSAYANPVFVFDSYISSGADQGKKTVKCVGSLDPVSIAGETMYFYDMTGGHNAVSAVFEGEGLQQQILALNTASVPYSVIVPADVDGIPYQSVTFLDANGNALSETYKFSGIVSGGEEELNFLAGTTDTFYYGVTEYADGTKESYWGAKRPTTVSSIIGYELYFDKMFFTVGSGDVFKIGDTEILLTDTYVVNSDTYKVTIPSETAATTNTVLSFQKSDGTIYHFFWDDLSLNEASLTTGNKAGVVRNYDSTIAQTVFFDAALSKLVYGGGDGTNGGDYGIPNSSGTIRYYATGSGKSDLEGVPEPMPEITVNGQTYDSLYRVDLPAGYTNIAFSSFDMSSITNYGAHGESTTKLTIPTNLTTPCFSADTSDSTVYDGSGQRGGYWAELGTVRDPEKLGSDTATNTVVDIPVADLTREDDVLYLATTFYDYYSDYELNGSNRDNYGTVTTNHRIYQPFRQLNQALSEYYRESITNSPLYWGNFQNYSGSPYSEISSTLNLYGSDNTKQLFYENNSMWGIDGREIGDPPAEYATQGLVSNSLDENGNLMLTTKSGTVIAPFFNTEFLRGNNIKNTTLAKVYENVTFPFKKASLTSKSASSVSGTVDYWYFDSKESSNNLRMTQDSSGNYFLKSSSSVVKGTTTDGITTNGNFFPFNNSTQSGNAGKLNYGFGTKFELNFRLTADGMVVNSDDNKVPIEFNFSGDDDIWIFVDGELALDLGGDHGVVEGYLNFADKTFYVNRVKDTSESIGYASDITGTFTINGSNADEHTLTLFYMERGLWESNMYMSFNFPDENSLEVEKEVDDSEVNQELFGGLFDSYSFAFNIRNLATHYGTKAVSDNADDLTGFITKQYDIPDYGSATSGKLEYPEGAGYVLTTKDGTTSGQLDDTGTFQLGDGDNIVFHDQFRRGSYISVNEVGNVLFDTTWTMYEDDVPVTSMAEGDTILLGADGTGTNLTNVNSTGVDDGRTEVYQTGTEDGNTIQNAGYTASEKPDDNTIVFRSYLQPDSEIASTTLKIVYTNKVKTGSIKITKANTYAADVLNGDYTFVITFSDVGGENLENGAVIQKSITLKNGESGIITGIPIHTAYTITEIVSDDSILTGVTEANGKTFTNTSGVISGTITNDADTYDYDYTFKNTLEPVINVDVEKQWKDMEGNTITENLPESVTVQLQRRQGTDDFGKIDGVDDVTLNSTNGWKHSFSDLNKYVDYTADPLVSWEYRVVELDANGNVVEADGVSGDYRVSYSSANKEVDGTTTQDIVYTITNTYIPRTSFKITKVDAANPDTKLADVTFQLEKLNVDNTIDTTFTAVSKSTDSQGVVEFTDLQEGTYRLTETKTLSNYSLLKEPIVIVVSRSGGDSTINGETCTISEDAISFTVTNRQMFSLPSTGGYGRTVMVLAGLILIWIAGLIYIIRKQKSENA